MKILQVETFLTHLFSESIKKKTYFINNLKVI